MADSDQQNSFDVYADAFTITVTPFGANLSFDVRDPHPSAGQAPKNRRLGTVRMSVEHLKTMIMIIRRQINNAESQNGVQAEVSRDILNQLGISPEDWTEFWRPTPNF